MADLTCAMGGGGGGPEDDECGGYLLLSPIIMLMGRNGSQRKVETHFGLPDSGFFSPFFLFALGSRLYCLFPRKRKQRNVPL